MKEEGTQGCPSRQAPRRRWVSLCSAQSMECLNRMVFERGLKPTFNDNFLLRKEIDGVTSLAV